MIGSICILLGWVGIAWALDWVGFFRGRPPLVGYERILASLCWPYVLVVLLVVFAVVGLPMVIAWIKGRVK